jgi:hypothetical protein
MNIKVELITIRGNISYSIATGCGDKVLDFQTEHEVRRMMGDMRAIAENIDALIRKAEAEPRVDYVGADGEVARWARVPTVEPAPGETIGADGEITRQTGKAQP